MPPKKGLATTKKVDKYIYVHEDVSPSISTVKGSNFAKARALLRDKSTPAKSPHSSCSLLADFDEENIEPADPRGIPNSLIWFSPAKTQRASIKTSRNRAFSPIACSRPRTKSTLFHGSRVLAQISLQNIRTACSKQTHLSKTLLASQVLSTTTTRPPNNGPQTPPRLTTSHPAASAWTLTSQTPLTNHTSHQILPSPSPPQR